MGTMRLTILGTALAELGLLWAQAANPDTLGGASGWVGAGLLGLVLAWLLLRHLPDKDRQLEKLIEGNRTHVEAVLDKSFGEMASQRKAHEESVERRHQENQAGVHRILEEEKLTRHAVKNLDQNLVVNTALTRQVLDLASGRQPKADPQ